MNIAIIYLFNRACMRLFLFIKHWYVDAPKNIYHVYKANSRSIENIYALRLTVRHILEPIYGDYSIVGRIVGPIFRLIRIFIGLIIHAITALIFSLVVIVWCAVPLFLIFYIISEFIINL